ncbi:uncharacterized protein [Amphiura filiformis]|uniref:uncharacterized protein n=1 Tax=Amphiura filiformis TaxID=82378 RepID=UPI003B21DD63
MAVATAQRTKEKTGEWSNIFPPEQLSETQSALFVKKLMAVAVSNITYLRTIFPEHAFGDRCLDDLNLKILRDDSACPGACQVIKWVKGCFDALDKKYLRALVIGIYVDPDDPETVIESYTFKFSYTNRGPSMNIYRNDKKIAGAQTEAETKKATIRLLRTIVVLTQTLKSLPDDVMMTMKLLYYEDVTPPGYEPPGFQAAERDDFSYEEEPMNIKVGDVSTAFHTVKLRIKTDCKQFELKEDEEEEAAEEQMNEGTSVVSDAGLDHEEESQDMERTTSERDAKKTKQKQKEPVAADSAPEGTPNVPGKSDEAVANTPASQISEDMAECIVRCPCGYNEDDGLMICCEQCKYWQHAVCFSILSEDDAPETHFCEECVKAGGENCHPTDPYLTALDSVAVQATCLWRRALLAATETNRILIPSFARRLGVEGTVASGLVNRMEREGYCEPAKKGKRLGKAVNKEKLMQEGLKKYFDGNGGISPETAEEQTEKVNKDETKEDNNAQTNANELEKLTQQAAEMDVSGRHTRTRGRGKRGKSENAPVNESQVASTSDQTQQEVNTGRGRKGKQSKKRAVPVDDDEYEFDVSNSQDSTVGNRDRKRRKASVVSRPILV